MIFFRKMFAGSRARYLFEEKIVKQDIVHPPISKHAGLIVITAEINLEQARTSIMRSLTNTNTFLPCYWYMRDYFSEFACWILFDFF